MRIIYCDFDGVLHPVSALQGFEMRLPREEVVRKGRLFRWTHVLNELLINHSDVRIAVHSSWRELLPKHEIRRYLGPLGERFLCSTVHGDRWSSILQSVDRLQPSAWIVLDDHASQFPVRALPELIVCDSESGIWDASIRRLIATWLDAGAHKVSKRNTV